MSSRIVGVSVYVKIGANPVQVASDIKGTREILAQEIRQKYAPTMPETMIKDLITSSAFNTDTMWDASHTIGVRVTTLAIVPTEKAGVIKQGIGPAPDKVEKLPKNASKTKYAYEESLHKRIDDILSKLLDD